MDHRVQLRRWLTALLLIGVIVPIVTFGGQWVFFLLIGLVVTLSQLEFEKLSAIRQRRSTRIAGIMIALTMPFAATIWGERGLLMAVAGSLITWLIVEMALREGLQGVSQQLGTRMLGYLYGGLLPSYFILLWGLPNGNHWLFWTVTVTAVGDSAAYYVGSLWGKTKLLPRISPHKTIEGSVAGLAGNVAGGLIYGFFLFSDQMSLNGSVLAFLVGGVGQLGDLSESMLKRAVGLKDSSMLLPGHGGILDRLDSLMFAIPLVFYWVTLG